MKRTNKYSAIFLCIAMWFCSQHVMAQNKAIHLDLPKEYDFSVKMDTAEKAVTMISYEAIDRETKKRPFEIIATTIENTPELKSTDELIRSIVQRIQQSSPTAQLTLVKEDADSKKLYRISSKDEKDARALLIMIYKTSQKWTMIEMEIPEEELSRVPMKRWETIFWNVSDGE